MAPRPKEEHFALSALRSRWALLALTAAILLAAGFSLLTSSWRPETASSWAGLAAIALAYQLLFHYRDLALNHRPGKSRLLAAFGPGTQLSLLRLLCIGVLAGFLFQARPGGWLAWAPFCLNLLANSTDFFDGYLARLSGQVTELGRKLDLDLDGRGLLIVSLLAVQYGAVPA
jgi:CDP-diacylglycerol--glycerol-3-phosphate 3-phosphatidyltransferase